MDCCTIIGLNTSHQLQVVPSPTDEYTTELLMDIFCQAKVYTLPVHCCLADEIGDKTKTFTAVSYI